MTTPKSAAQAKAAWLFALAEPTRLAILRLLAAGALNVTEVARVLETEPMNVSHHLNLLQRAGFLSVRKRGKFREYELAGWKVTPVTITLTHESGIAVAIPLG